MWPNLQETADLVTFTEEMPKEKFGFLCSKSKRIWSQDAEIKGNGSPLILLWVWDFT